MKRLLSVGIMAGLAAGATACHREAEVLPEPGLTSTWRWASTSGGLAGTTTTPASTGTALTWQFRPDSTLVMTTTRLAGSPVVETAGYSLGSVRSIYSGQPAPGLTLHGRTPTRYVVREMGTRLVLAENSYDGLTLTFER